MAGNNSAIRLSNWAFSNKAELRWFDELITRNNEMLWYCIVQVNNERLGEGEGRKKGIARENAAVQAWKEIASRTAES